MAARRLPAAPNRLWAGLARPRARAQVAESGPSRVRDLLAVGLVVVLAVAVLAGLAVLPTKTWLSQRDKMAEAEAELARIEAEILELEERYRLLGTDAEIEIVARRDYGLVRPGDESYRIVTP